MRSSVTRPDLRTTNTMMTPGRVLPDRIDSAAVLDDLLSAPTPGVVETLARISGDIVVLGVGGKMGPSLAAMIKRASDAAGVRRQVIGVSRFGSSTAEEALRAQGIQTVRADLLDAD